MFERILVASDLSPISEPALRTAVGLARAQRSSLTVLHVSERHHQSDHWLVPFFAEELRVYTAAVKREEEAARALLEGALMQLTDGAPIAHEIVIVHGRAADTITAEADKRQAALIVVGTHGRAGVLGSVAERVVRTAHRPVLVVPAKEQP